MNGQQLTNSSNSANGTPSSSYPASLSSQSSRDGSPAPRVGAPRKPLPEQSYNWPPISSPSQVKDETRGLPTSAAQPLGGSSIPHKPLPSSPLSSHTVPSQNNHLPQFNSLNKQFPDNTRPPYTHQVPQSSEPLRSTQNLLQPSSNQVQSQTPLSNQFTQSNQFQKLSPNRTHQQTDQSQKTHEEQPNEQSQLPGQVSYSLKQNSQSPSQFSQHHNQPLQNQLIQPHNQVPPSQNRYPHTQNQTMPSQNHFLQPQNQTPPVQNNLPPLHNQFSPLQNQIPPVQNKIPPLQNQLPPSQHQFQPPQNQFPPSQHQFQPSQNQVLPPQNQFSQAPNQVYNPPNQMSQTLNHVTQPLGQQIVNQQSLVQNQPYSSSQLPPPFANQFNKRYPQMPMQPGYQSGPMDGLNTQMAGMTVNQGFNKMWGMDSVDLLKCRDLIPPEKLEPPPIRLQHELYESANCSPEIFRCTLTKIPETKSLLDKSRLPLGVLIHPFKDLNQLSVIQCTVIVRCRVCRTYINPFVYFVDNKRWKCNLCFRVNELPDEFQFDPMTKTYGDPSRRPEIKSATIEFIAPSEYMVRPPQPAVYVFVLDVSRLACECGYLDAVCRTLLAELDNVPGDARTSVAFITFDSAVHFYSLADGQAQPHQMTVVDIDDMFLPTPENLLVSLSESRELIKDLLQQLPEKFKESYDTHSALGAALQAAYKLLSPTGGRVTVFQACLPNVGPGALTAREDPAQRAGDNPPHLNPSTDFYKKLALDCSGQQIAVDLFLVNSQYVDLATISGVSRFSGGCMHHVPLYRSDKPALVDSLERMFQRYLTRKIGFESVMRLRCTRGLSIHTFHGNFFVRSTDLLSLPNANPDAGFGMQVTIDENLTEVQNVCFQAALLYTSSKGERRIRVHTLCLPVVSNLADVIHSADQQCIAGLLAKMAVDRAVQSSLSDAREAFVNVVADVLSAYKLTQSSNTAGLLLAPSNLKLLPLYILALLKHVAFRIGQSTRLDDRVFAMCQMKSLPLTFLMQSIYPDLYSVIDIENYQRAVEGEDVTVPQPPRLQLSSERVDSHGLYLMDEGSSLFLYVGHNLQPAICQAVFHVPHFSAIPHDLLLLPEVDSPTSIALRTFVTYLQNEKPFPPPLQIIRDDSPHRMRFIERLVEDKNESGISYYEFIQQIKSIMK